MFELHVRCPTTGEPVYAGCQLTDAVTPELLSGNLICPACGGRHDWQAAAVWSVIPVAEPTHAASDVSPLSFEPPRDAPAGTPPDAAAWPNVA